MLRPLILVGCLVTSLLALYSCSMQAALTTDDDGRILEVSSLRIESSLSRWAIRMLIVGGQLAIELRSTRPSGAQMRTRIDRQGHDVATAVVATA